MAQVRAHANCESSICTDCKLACPFTLFLLHVFVVASGYLLVVLYWSDIGSYFVQSDVWIASSSATRTDADRHVVLLDKL